MNTHRFRYVFGAIKAQIHHTSNATGIAVINSCVGKVLPDMPIMYQEAIQQSENPIPTIILKNCSVLSIFILKKICKGEIPDSPLAFCVIWAMSSRLVIGVAPQCTNLCIVSNRLIGQTSPHCTTLQNLIPALTLLYFYPKVFG